MSHHARKIRWMKCVVGKAFRRGNTDPFGRSYPPDDFRSVGSIKPITAANCGGKRISKFCGDRGAGVRSVGESGLELSCLNQSIYPADRSTLKLCVDVADQFRSRNRLSAFAEYPWISCGVIACRRLNACARA